MLRSRVFYAARDVEHKTWACFMSALSGYIHSK